MDQSPKMVALALSQLPQGVAILADALLNDGSRHRVYKRYLSGQQLADELGGHTLLDGTWFAAADVRWRL